MTSSEIRQQFLDFFKSKEHHIVPSAPIVVKNDPTLLFTNAGMNQFKDYFLGNQKPAYSRVADTQKCLRVSGKHNDLEEVGVDTYHHTMFEMLGNWSFGDPGNPEAGYFKKEAIAWSWELLTKVFKIDKDRLYVSVFEGDEKEGLPFDEEAYNEWKNWIAEDRIIRGKKKDNFWEMGDTGPCGPCSEIHVDCRTEEERKSMEGKTLVNADHPQVIEIWNNVFMEFNRLKDGTLQKLPARHVDTGMGFERLVRVLQGKTSNYDTDVFTGTINAIGEIVNKEYENDDSKSSVAFRVISDHIRAICFTIADGQLPSNTGAGYVVRRILRRAVRYYYSYLDYKQPLLHQLVLIIAGQFEHVFPELKNQQEFVAKVIKEEEEAFLRTLEKGINTFYKIICGVESVRKRVDAFLNKNGIQFTFREAKDFSGIELYLSGYDKVIKIEESYDHKDYKPNSNEIYLNTLDFINQLNFKRIENSMASLGIIKNLDLSLLKTISGKDAFSLYDTYGFPFDLTQLMAKECGLYVDEPGFEAEMQQQKNRSRQATAIDAGDWTVVNETERSSFVGYDRLSVQTRIIKYRKVKAKNKEQYQVVLEATPFYAESGGQVGDRGVLKAGDESIYVTDTKKENDLIIHFTDKLFTDMSAEITAEVSADKRLHTAYNHTATHLLHAALKQVLGNHVNQKGSLVNEEVLRFDVSHFAKISDEELNAITDIVNEKIRENLSVVIEEKSKEAALESGAMALFGEKYGDVVRVVTIHPTFSVELCGGTHVHQTGEIGTFVITSETAVAAGVRRIEALTGAAALRFLTQKMHESKAISEILKTKDPVKSVEKLIEDKAALEKKIEAYEAREMAAVSKELALKVETVNGVNFIGQQAEVSSADALKKICFDMKPLLKQNYLVVLTANIAGKAAVAVLLDEKLAEEKSLDAGKIIKQQIAPLIKGGGGGQKALATAGGQDVTNLAKVIETVKALL